MFRARRPELITLAVATFVALVLNEPFWRAFHAAVAPGSLRAWAFMLATGIGLVMICNAILLLFAVRPLFRVLLGILLPLTAAAAYFMHEYGVVIDANMVQNVFETNGREAGDLITTKLVFAILMLGVLPAVLVWLLPWDEEPGTIVSWPKVRALFVSVVIAVIAVFPFWGDFLSTFREYKELHLKLTPLNYISALNRYARSKVSSGPRVVQKIGEDAKRSVPSAVAAKKRLFVIVVGETARADHFGLNGYTRQTTPELAKVQGLINYPNASSCGTDTAQSVPCMFSGLGRKNFSNAAAAARENLLDILKRTGVDVVWHDNQAGCKGVCLRVTSQLLSAKLHPSYSERGENGDEILIDGLDERIAKLDRETVLVLHMMGSHGPAYWKRVPERMEVFKPICRASQFSGCTNDEIVNAYDNTILYTDFVLSQLIAKLSAGAQQGVETGMIYMSDHGESLGENNVYLHGMPYALAPRAQTHVPFFMWLSPSLKSSAWVDATCLAHRATADVSHDNLFHSVLGLIDVSTKVYDAKLDLFAPCRTPPKP